MGVIFEFGCVGVDDIFLELGMICSMNLLYHFTPISDLFSHSLATYTVILPSLHLMEGDHCLLMDQV